MKNGRSVRGGSAEHSDTCKGGFTMSNSNSTKPTDQSKPERPDGSPLFWHKTGRWCKKVRGRFVYFGRGTHDEALAEYERQMADLHSGRTQQEEPEGLTVFR